MNRIAPRNTKISTTTLAALASAVLAVGVIGCSSEDHQNQRPVMYGTSGNRSSTVPPVEAANGGGDHTPSQNQPFANGSMGGPAGAQNGAAVGASATIPGTGSTNVGAAAGTAGAGAAGNAAAPNTTVTNGTGTGAAGTANGTAGGTLAPGAGNGSDVIVTSPGVI